MPETFEEILAGATAGWATPTQTDTPDDLNGSYDLAWNGGSPAYANGQFGRAFDINLTRSLRYTPLSDFSGAEEAGAYFAIVTPGDAHSTNNGNIFGPNVLLWRFVYAASGRIKASFKDAGGSETILDGGAYTIGQPIAVGFAWGDGDQRLYTSVTTDSATETIQTGQSIGSQYLGIGGYESGASNTRFVGKIETALVLPSLSAEQFATLIAGPQASGPTSIKTNLRANLRAVL